MKTILITIMVVLVFNTAGTISGETPGKVYFPLKTGNVWVYRFSVGISGTERGNGFYRLLIGGEQIINGKTYFQVSLSRIQVLGTDYCSNRLLYPNSFIRIDTVSGTIYRSGGCSIGDEGLTDSLSARKNDTVKICESTQYTAVCADTNIETVLGFTKKTKNFVRQTFSTYSTMKYAEDLGLIMSSASQSMYSCLITLKGCSIDGVMYGDTSTVTGIILINTEVPEVFCLLQNYPNPFNPVTKIRFQLPQSSFTELTIYDNSGKIIQTPVKEFLSEGSYEYNFDGSLLASGVYFYRITAEGGSQKFTKTMKMIIVK